MAGIKIKAADSWFSKCVREAANWTCQKCGTQHQRKSRGLECSHYHGRGKWSVRFDPDNCLALCTACHFLVGGNPELHTELFRSLRGEGLMSILREKVNDLSLGRQAKREEKQISKHYRELLKVLESRRDAGEMGVFEIEGYL
jgi:hypothetical protein